MSSSSSSNEDTQASSLKEFLEQQSVANYLAKSREIMGKKIRDLYEFEEEKKKSFDKAVAYARDVHSTSLEFDSEAILSFNLISRKPISIEHYWYAEERGEFEFAIHRSTNDEDCDAPHKVKIFSGTWIDEGHFLTPINDENNLFFGVPITTKRDEDSTRDTITLCETFNTASCVHRNNEGDIVADIDDEELGVDGDVVHMGLTPYSVSTVSYKHHSIFVVRNMRGGEKRAFISDEEPGYTSRIFLLNEEFFFVQHSKAKSHTRIVHAISGKCIHEFKKDFKQVVVCECYVALLSRSDDETKIVVLLDEKDE